MLNVVSPQHHISAQSPLPESQNLTASSMQKLHRLQKTEERAKELLERHPHFHGRSHWVQCRFSGRRLYLTGKLPSYYLKQLAQEAVRELAGVDRIENNIEVASPVGEVFDPNESPEQRKPK